MQILIQTLLLYIKLTIFSDWLKAYSEFACDVITADYTIIMPRTLKVTGNHVKVTGNHVMYDRGA